MDRLDQYASGDEPGPLHDGIRQYGGWACGSEFYSPLFAMGGQHRAELGRG